MGANPSKKTTQGQGISHYALSDDCAKCSDKCWKGIEYLKVFAITKEGRGVICPKK